VHFTNAAFTRAKNRIGLSSATNNVNLACADTETLRQSVRRASV
jgi:hypothetical protein